MTETVSSNRGFLDFSPRRGDDTEKENDVPVLSLIQFTKPPFVSFGSVKLGTSRSALLRVENPLDDEEVEVRIEKIPSVRGFSVDRGSFTIQPESSFTLTVTWTPTEEGGVRELLVFNANGILKHQAVLLGRATVPKKKKRSLWDSIKSKRAGDKVLTPRRRKAEPRLKMGANKTFQVSRKSQYQRDTNRSPLVPLNEEKLVRRRSHTKRSTSDDCGLKAEERQAPNTKPRPPTLGNGTNILLSPAGSLTESCSTLGKVEHKAPTIKLNKTLSPIGTPETFRKLMPRIQLHSPPSATDNTEAAVGASAHHQVLSLTDALIMIGSDLSPINARAESTSDSCELSDSLESQKENFSRGAEAHVLPDSPEGARTNEPRLTFFVSKKTVTEMGTVTKACVDSTTVTKGKAPVVPRLSGGRRVKKSRRRLMEKTLELSDSSGPSNSGPITPTLPVIQPEPTNAAPESRSPLCRVSPTACAAVVLPDSPAACSIDPLLLSVPPLAYPSPRPVDTSSPLHCKTSPSLIFGLKPKVSTPPCRKKRKSTELLKADESKEDAGKSERVKRTRVMTMKPEQQKKCVSQRTRTAGTSRSISSSSSSSSSSKTTKSRELSKAKQATCRVSARGSAPVKTTRVVAVAQSKLTFVRPTQTALPRHPMPFAAKNMFYDERWIEKQECGFTWWINYVLTPEDFKVNTEVTKVNAVSLAMGGSDKLSVPAAPTKEEMSFSTYTARRKLNRLRRSACQLFTSEAVVKAIQRLELEVEARRLLVRKDRHLWKDIGERRKVLDWLLSYNPLWLRIGLETIYGELISLESNSDTLGLAMFILQRLLWNPDIAAEFSHPRVPHLYRDGHEEALSRFTLKKLLLLVCFLDKAKESRLIEHDPCLFCVDAEFKSSRDLLLAFSRDFLSGEGILSRHLGYLGFPVSHVQTPLDEFDYAVKNLAVDLKCGIRLVRVVELLVQDWSLSAKLRLPAISRLQKVHNVDVALQELRRKGVELKDEHGSDIDSRDIVDGHRDKTLSLLWKISFAFHVEVILSEEQLRDEISFLRRTLWSKQRRTFLRTNQNVRQSPARAPYQHSSAKISLLMDWIRTVCDFYSLKVENFTVAFSDGRVLCYLIHHYHPSLLPEAAVSHRTTQTVECSHRGRLELNCSTSDSDASFDSVPASLNVADSQSLEFKELLENEKSNFRLVSGAVAFLGGVPAMISPSDMSNTIPNEKVVMAYLSFLCVRLLDLRNESRAARVIQDAWRRHRLRKDLQLYTERNAAALKIQVRVRSFLRKRRIGRENLAAVVIQSSWRRHAARQQLRLERRAELQRKQHQAATVLQAHWRTYAATKAYRHLRCRVIVLQAQWRMKRSLSAYTKIRRSVAVLQRQWRARTLAKTEREHFLHLRASVVRIQRGYRRWRSQKTQKENQAAGVIQAAFRRWYAAKTAERSSAAVKIQSWYRMQVCVDQYKRTRRSAVLLQAWCRGRAQRRHFQTMKLQHHAAIVVQSAFRGHEVRKQVAETKRAAIVIQQRFRAAAVRMRFVKMKMAAVTIQAAYRGRVTREALKEQHQAATVIQAAFRTRAAQRRYVLLQEAAVHIQQRYRATRLARDTKAQYEALRRAAVTLQAGWRGTADRRRLRTLHKCAAVIQACYRGHKVQSEYRSKRAAAVVLQRRYRSLLATKAVRQGYLQRKRACIVLQAAFRGMTVRTTLREKHQAAMVIQSFVRMSICRKRYSLLRSATVVIQSRYRAVLLCTAQRREFLLLKEATMRIQAAFREHRAMRRCRAATLIQAQFRMHRVRSVYRATKHATIAVQRRYRANVCRAEALQKYRAMKAAALILQAAYRGHKVRRTVAEMHRAAAVIQRHFLTVKQRRAFLCVRAAAVTCQQRYRATATARRLRHQYVCKRRAVVSLQAAFRGFTARKQLQMQHKAAATIQSHFRKHRQRTRYTRLRGAAVVLQQCYRAKRKMRAAMLTLRAKRNATLILQASFRGMATRRMLRRRQNAARVIQRAVRAHRQRRRFLEMKSHVIAVQRRFRANQAAKKQRDVYQNIQKAVLVLQAGFRGRCVREKVSGWHQAATVIQRTYRAQCDRRRFLQLRANVLTLQRRYRANVAAQKQRKEYESIQKATVTLQAAYRGRRARRDVVKLHRAAVVIQANFRRHRQQAAFLRQHWAVCVLQQRFRAQKQKLLHVTRYQEVRKAVVVLQAAFRGMKSRRGLTQRHQAATVIQRTYRAQCDRRSFLQLRANVLTLQRRYRANVAAQKQRKEYESIQKATVTLQAAYRGMKVREEVSRWHQAATVIQSAFRRRREEVKYKATCRAVVVIQRRYRALLLQRAQRESYEQQKSSVRVLQAAFRRWQSRREVGRRHGAATVIQACWRRCMQQRRFLRLRWAALTLQRRFRLKQLCREERRRQELEAAQAAKRRRFTSAVFHHLSAIRIQRAVRAHWALEAARRQITSVVTIQRWVRAAQQRRRYLEQRAKVLRAQRAVRRWLRRRHQAALLIQTAVRKFLALRRQERAQQGIVKAQALWRGHRSRRLNNNPKLVKLRWRLRELAASAREEDKLCNKTSLALERLLHYKYISSILQALKNLETSTRLSPQCCERLVESGATDVIFTLIRGCNRSVPCMDVITFSIQILLNLSKYHKTTAAVYSAERSVETLLDLLQRYREKAGDKVADKGGSIFTKACFLLALLLQDRCRAEEVMKMPRVSERITSIYRLTARKHKLEAERSVIKQKSNASINGSVFIPSTPRHRPSPRFAPDWVLRKDKVKDIANPLQALQMVAQQLHVLL